MNEIMLMSGFTSDVFTIGIDDELRIIFSWKTGRQPIDWMDSAYEVLHVVKATTPADLDAWFDEQLKKSGISYIRCAATTTELPKFFFQQVDWLERLAEHFRNA